MEKGFHNIEQFIAFITPGHTAFHERLSIGVYRRGRTREFSPHKEKPPPARAESIELLDAAIQGQLFLSIGTKLAVFLYHSQVLSGAGHRQKLRKSIGILETFGGKAMWQRNNGQAEDDLQFRFTAYLVSAVKRRRKDYLIQLYKRSSIESTVEVVYESEPSSEEVVLDRLPLMDVIENGALLEALQKLNERERQIFLARTLEEEDFETLGVRFGLSYKGVAALYYRTIQKIRKSIEGGDKK